MIIEFLSQFSPVIQALIAGIFTWLMTAFGALGVFFFKKINRYVLDAMLGFAAGVMIAASFWSLLAPGIELAEEQGKAGWFPAVVGFLLGGVFLLTIHKILPHLHVIKNNEYKEGIKTDWSRSILLVLAITIHNIPEGLAVGTAFGAAAANLSSATIAAAIALAIGIGIQNFPEGFVVSIPLRREYMSRFKSFWYGQLSGIVEPIGAVIGAVIVMSMRSLLPYALSFAAGAMIFVVIEELIPESQHSKNSIATIGAMSGFAVMMFLDVALG